MPIPLIIPAFKLLIFTFQRLLYSVQVGYRQFTRTNRKRLIDNTADTLAAGRPYDPQLLNPLNELPVFDFPRDGETAPQAGALQDLLNDEAFPRDVLDFGVDLIFNTPSVFDTEFQMLAEHYPFTFSVDSKDADLEGQRSGFVTPGLRGKFNINASTQAFKESLWLWTPAKGDHGALDQLNLSLPWDSVFVNDQGSIELSPSCERVSKTTRGKVLAMVLRTCEKDMYQHIVSNFPGTDLLTRLIHNFINFHARTDMPWIHLATIEVNKESPEFLGSMVAYGAAISTEPELRKLGFAIQEAVRMANPHEVSATSTLLTSSKC